MRFLVWVYTSQDFAQTQQNFARLHNPVTVTLRNSGGLGNLGTCELRNLETWELGNLGAWELRNLGTWNLGSWELGNLGTWELGKLETLELATSWGKKSCNLFGQKKSCSLSGQK